MLSEIRNCPVHGSTEFHYYEKSGRKGLWKCLKCESELAILNKLKYKLKAILYKGNCCSICGYNKNISALEFHHIDPSLKDFTISNTRRSWESTKEELDKCILVCANCHREIHNPNSNPEYLELLILNHDLDIKLKQEKIKLNKYKFNLEELNKKRSEMSSWEEVAKYFNISISTLKRHKKELELMEELHNG